MAEGIQWVVVCAPAGTVGGQLRSGATTITCTTPEGVAGVAQMTKAYLSESTSQPNVPGESVANNWQELGNISISDAHVIGASVGLVWAIAWGFRAMRLALFDPSSDSGD